MEPDNLTTRRLTAASLLSIVVNGRRQSQETPGAHPSGKASSSAKQLTWSLTEREALSLAHRGVGDVLRFRVVAVCDTIQSVPSACHVFFGSCRSSSGNKPHFMLHLNLTRPIAIIIETYHVFEHSSLPLLRSRERAPFGFSSKQWRGCLDRVYS